MVIVWLLFALAAVLGLNSIGAPKSNAAPFFTPGIILLLIIGGIVGGCIVGPWLESLPR